MKNILKILLPVLILLIGGTALGLMIKFRKQVKPEPVQVLPPLVEFLRVTNENHQFRVETQGTVRPRTEIQLVSEVAGRVIAVSPSLDAGGFFEEGEVLLSVDPRDFELAVTRAEAQVAEGRYRWQLEKAEAEVARAEWKDIGQGDATPLLLREPQVAQAEAMLSSAQAALEQARRDLERCHMRAPFAGRVGEKKADVGQYVAKGTSVARLYAVDYAEVRLPLSADQLAYVEVPLDYRDQPRTQAGPEVLLRARVAGQTHVWTGRIDRTEGEIDPRTRMLFAVARVPNPYDSGAGGDGDPAETRRAPLASGMFVDAEILGRCATNVMVLPRSVLRGEKEVLVIDDEERLRTREVRVLKANRREVVIGKGLRDGERVCTSPLEVVVDGMKVRLKEGA